MTPGWEVDQQEPVEEEIGWADSFLNLKVKFYYINNFMWNQHTNTHTLRNIYIQTHSCSCIYKCVCACVR